MSVSLRASVVGGAIGFALMIVTGGARAQEAPVTSEEPGLGSSEAIVARLQDTVVDADYQAADFSAVVDDIRERYGINVHVAWNSLNRIEVRKDDRVTVLLHRVPLATVLEIVCRELGKDPEAITYGVQAGVVVIAPVEELRRVRLARPYDVTDLIESGYSARRFANTPVLSLELTGREFVGGERIPGGGGFGGGGGGGGLGGGAGGGGHIFGDPADEMPRMTRMERMEEIIDLLVQSVDPETWEDNGGTVASVTAFNGTLLIRHTAEGHRRVAAFFDLLRASRPQPLDGDVIVARLRPDKASEWRRAIGERYPRVEGTRLAELLDALGDEGVLFRASTSGFNGERMWFSALGQRTVLTDFIPVVGEQTAGLQPISGIATDGLELIVLPLLRPQSGELTLDVQMAWVPTSSVGERSIAMALPDTQGSVDQVVQTMRTVSTTARLRLGEALALTIPHKLDDQGRAAPHEDWLIVLIRRAS